VQTEDHRITSGAGRRLGNQESVGLTASVNADFALLDSDG
jgi:hypothetical protein